VSVLVSAGVWEAVGVPVRVIVEGEKERVEVKVCVP